MNFFILDNPRMLITSYFTTKWSVINIRGQGRTKLYKSLPIEKKKCKPKLVFNPKVFELNLIKYEVNNIRVHLIYLAAKH